MNSILSFVALNHLFWLVYIVSTHKLGYFSPEMFRMYTPLPYMVKWTTRTPCSHTYMCLLILDIVPLHCYNNLSWAVFPTDFEVCCILCFWCYSKQRHFRQISEQFWKSPHISVIIRCLYTVLLAMQLTYTVFIRPNTLDPSFTLLSQVLFCCNWSH